GALRAAGCPPRPAGGPPRAPCAGGRGGGANSPPGAGAARLWQDNAATPPEPMTTMPIDWTHAFGGPAFERNPYGKGVAPLNEDGRSHHPLPNVERYG